MRHEAVGATLFRGFIINLSLGGGAWECTVAAINLKTKHYDTEQYRRSEAENPQGS